MIQSASATLDAPSTPPSPPSLPPVAAYAAAASDVAPRTSKEAELCERASHPDWVYLGALGVLDVVALGSGAVVDLKHSGNVVSLTWPVAIGLAWGATLGGGWLALPKCSPRWLGEAPPEGNVRDPAPLALSIALLAAATAPVISAIAIGSDDLPRDWSDADRVVHVAAAAVAGFGGALLPYLLPPRTWTAASRLEHLRLGMNGEGAVWLGYGARF